MDQREVEAELRRLAAGAKLDADEYDRCGKPIGDAAASGGAFAYAHAADLVRDAAGWEKRSPAGEAYQARVGTWMADVFAAGGADTRTRIDRLVEEVFELSQALNYDPSRLATIRDYVFSRPVGEPQQEMGGVMVTLASLACSAGIDMAGEGERELTRIHMPEVRAKIMAKQASKNGLHTPLPTARTPQPSLSEVEG